MAQWHGISNRKSTGGRLVQARGKRRTEISSETGGNTMVRVLMENRESVNDAKTGKTK